MCFFPGNGPPAVAAGDRENDAFCYSVSYGFQIGFFLCLIKQFA